MKFSLKAFLVMAVIVTGVLFANHAKAQKSGPRLFNANISPMAVSLGTYDRTSSNAFRQNIETSTARSQSVSNYLFQRSGIELPSSALAVDDKSDNAVLSSAQLADIFLDQALTRIQKSDNASFKDFLTQAAGNRGMFVRLDSAGRANVIGQNDIIFGLAFARKKGDRETMKALAKPFVQDAIETTGAYFAQASPEFKRNTVDGTRFPAPEGMLVLYSIISNDFGVTQPSKEGERISGPNGTANQFPVAFFIDRELAGRLSSGR
jgi:hypothetical protein